jgi:hypothetical protein
MKEAQDKQKGYVDNHKWPLELVVRDKVFLKVVFWKTIIWFRMKGKLAPRCIEPFEVIEIIEHVAYHLMFPP